MSPATGPGSEQRGLEHRGLLHDSADDLAGTLLPTVRAALDAGDAVTLVVDRRTVRELREGLGPAADAATFVPPAEAVRAGPAAFLRLLRSWASPGRRALVVGQYAALDGAGAAAGTDPAPGTGSDTGRALVEEGVDLVLADLAMTVLCACARDDAPGAVAQLRRHHRHLDDGAGPVDNPDHRPAADRSPVPGALWGSPVLRADFRELADLRALRGRVAGATAEAGLAGEPADAAVLAVHEAAVLACALRGDAGADCTVEIRAGEGAMLTEVTAPGSAAEHADDPLAVLRLFSRAASLDAADGAGRRIRLLSTTADDRLRSR